MDLWAFPHKYRQDHWQNKDTLQPIRICKPCWRRGGFLPGKNSRDMIQLKDIKNITEKPWGCHFPMQQDQNFPRWFLRTKNIFKYQLVTRSIGRDCDKNHVFRANLRDKNGVENFVNPNEDTYFRVKRKRMAFSRYPEICHEKVMFQSLKSILSYLESFQDQIATQGFTLPWTPDFVDDCLVRLVYLIHEPNRTSDESFSFNPKTI